MRATWTMGTSSVDWTLGYVPIASHGFRAYVDADGDFAGDPLQFEDVYGHYPPTGYAVTGDDCDDANPAVHPGVLEVCDGVDNDCDGYLDATSRGPLISGPACSRQFGVCSGTFAPCEQGQWKLCGATEYGASYEADEQTCDGLDNDCDGVTDDARALCANQVGVCAGSLSAVCGPCEASAYGAKYEAIETSCDGLDNDCNGTVDDATTDRLCELQLGVCEGSRTNTCAPCEGTAYGPTFEASETSCDDLDNDCDGVVDEVTDGPLCPNQRGACYSSRSHECSNGAWLTCEPVAPQEREAACDGIDDDCDGKTDEGCNEPAGCGCTSAPSFGALLLLLLLRRRKAQ